MFCNGVFWIGGFGLMYKGIDLLIGLLFGGGEFEGEGVGVGELDGDGVGVGDFDGWGVGGWYL